MQPPTSRLERDRWALAIVRDLLAHAHRLSHARPIGGPDDDGTFPALAVLDSLGARTRVPPLVPDTNILRRDLGWACRHGDRTVLVNTANSGATRLLCPIHVIKEMFDHAEEFCEEMKIPVWLYLEVLRRDYLPLFRVVRDLPPGLWTTEEEARLAVLERADPNDVPAARLALVVGAYFVSTDNAALEAVYSNPVDPEIQSSWVTTLKSGGDASELANVLEAGALLCRLIGGGGAGLIRQFAGSTTTRALIVVTGALGTYALAGRSRRAQLLASSGRAGAVILKAFGRYVDATSQLRALAAPSPPADALASSVSPDGRLIRACLMAFCHSSWPTHSARELRDRLGSLDVPAGEHKIRAVLRGYDCFFEPRRGRFQLGHPTTVGR